MMMVLDKRKSKWLKHSSSKTITVKLVLDFIVNEYQRETQDSKKPKHSKFLLDLYKDISKWSKFSDAKRKQMKSAIDKKIMNIRILSNQRTKPARTYPPYKLLSLIQQNWLRPISGEGIKALTRKYTSAMAMICLVTGRRWIDITRLKWDCLESYTTKLGLFYKFHLPTSKTNVRGQRLESVTLRQVTSKKVIGPIQMIKMIHFWQGYPSKGFVFPCVSVKKVFTIDPIWYAWSSYRCPGHWDNRTKTECIGQINGNTTIGVLQRFATSLGWKTVPTKHTFRRLVTLLHKRQGFTREQINELMGWVPTSNMPVHYAAGQESLMRTAPANVYADELEKDRPFNQFSDLQFEV